MVIYIDMKGTLRGNCWCTDEEAEAAFAKLAEIYDVRRVSSLPGTDILDKVELMRRRQADGLLVDDDLELLRFWRHHGGIGVHASQLKNLAQVLTA